MWKPLRRARRLALLGLSLATAACAGLPSSTGSSSSGDADAAVFTVEPTLTDLQAKVFSPSCSFASCHGGNFPQSGLDTRTRESSFAGMVNKVARRGSCNPDAGPPVLIVAPGDPDNSQLVHKVEKTQAELMTACQGVPMPRSNARLPQAAIDAIRQWIAAGALDN